MKNKIQTPLFLYNHPTTPIPWIHSIHVECLWTNQGLTLIYQVLGDIQFLRIPAPSLGGQTDGLWNHTCCEAFIAEQSSTSYRELNLSPSGQWQLYQFSGYREGRTQIRVPAPLITQNIATDKFTLTANIPLDWLPGSSPLHLGLSMVLEDQNGNIYYWALNHPPGVPNFHCADTWTATI